MGDKKKRKNGKPPNTEVSPPDDNPEILQKLWSLYRSGALKELMEQKQVVDGKNKGAKSKPCPKRSAVAGTQQLQIAESAQADEDLGPGWVTPSAKKKPRKKKDSEAAIKGGDTTTKPAEKFQLAPTGWSVRVVEDAQKLLTSSAGVALAASGAQAMEIRAKCAHTKNQLAVLSPEAPTDDPANQPIWVQMRDGTGKVQLKKVWLIQLGSAQTKVVYRSPAKRVNVAQDTTVINLAGVKDWMARDAWRQMCAEPHQYGKEWLDKHAKVKAVDIFAPRIHKDKKGPYMIQIKARVPICQMEGLYSGSSAEGVSMWEITPPGQPPTNRAVWLPKGTTLQAAFQSAASIPGHQGVVCRPGGVGVRVKIEDFPVACEALLGKEEAGRLSGDRWEVRGVPVHWGVGAMRSALRALGWEDANPERARCAGLTRIWNIRALSPPPTNVLVFADDEEPATINRAQLRKRAAGSTNQTLVWSRAANTKNSNAHPGWVQGANLRTGLGWNQDHGGQAAPRLQAPPTVPQNQAYNLSDEGEDSDNMSDGNSSSDSDEFSDTEFGPANEDVQGTRVGEEPEAPAHAPPVERGPRPPRRVQGSQEEPSAVVQDLASQVGALTQVVRDMMTEMGNLRARIVDMATPVTPATQQVPNSPAVPPHPPAPVPETPATQQQPTWSQQTTQPTWSQVTQGAAPNPGRKTRRSVSIAGVRERPRRHRSSDQEEGGRDRSRDRPKPGVV